MGHVDEPGPVGGDVRGRVDGLFDGEVGGVLARAEGVEDEGAQAAKLTPGFGRDGGDVGAVGEGKWRFGIWDFGFRICFRNPKSQILNPQSKC